MPMGMATVTAYLILTLLVQPYRRRGDDKLQLLALAELLLIVMCADVLRVVSGICSCLM